MLTKDFLNGTHKASWFIVMTQREKVEEVLARAGTLEKKYNWLKAMDVYEQALREVGKEDFLKEGKIKERIGYCFYRAAFQAESGEEFKQWMQQAIEAYEKTKGFYEKLADEQKATRIFRCDATIAYMGYWLASEASEKKRLLDECWRLTSEGLEKAGNAWEYGRTFNQLSPSILFRFCLEWDFQARKKIIMEAIEHGERTIRGLSTSEDPYELARAYARTAFYIGVFDYYFLDIDEKGRENQKAQNYWLKANEISEEIALLEILYPVFGGKLALGWGEGTNETLMKLEKALKYARKTRDQLLIGWALDWLTYHTAWSGAAIESKDESLKLAKSILRYAVDAKKRYSPISFTSPRGDYAWVRITPGTWYWFALTSFETNLNKKRDLLEKAMQSMSDNLKVAEDSGYPEIILYVHCIFVGVLTSLSEIEPNSKKKKEFLEKALKHTSKAVQLTEQFQPFLYWNRGVMQKNLAKIKHELAQLAKKLEIKRDLFQEALSDLKNGVELLLKGILLYSKSSIMPFTSLGEAQCIYGNWLSNIYEYTSDREHLREAIGAFEDAAASFQKLDLRSRKAECYWKTAQAYDALGKNLKAAENFELASNSYSGAADKIPQLKDFYQDHALYMRSWSEIEKARHHHAKRQYELAKEHYEKAAGLHKSTERWSYLSLNYLAWARLEESEALSRREQTQEAKNLFQEAANLFLEAKKSVQGRLEKIESEDEKRMLINLAKASDVRYDYSLGRIALEEAKILDRRGDHTASSRKYGSAAEKFQKATDAAEEESDRQELKPIVFLCRAWQMMARAEAEISPDLYKEAARLFEEAKDHSLDEKAKMLALGHSRFCKALEAGTRFEDVRDTSLHTLATQHLESAASYYLKAGFKNASEYAEATQKLLDAYLYMHNAKIETDPAKKARFYMMAEKVLQVSAGSYVKAKNPAKQEQVSRLLEKVRKERELALSLTEVLRAPLATSTTATFATPTPGEETPIGLEQFEHADVQANLILGTKEAKVGEHVDLEIELVNAGKAPALLVKVEEVIPEKFEIKEIPQTYRVEDHYLNLKGKRLGPLKTEEVRMVVKPLSKGMFMVKPRILYLDETGKYKSHEPEPVKITVKELGISGWIRGKG